MACGSDGPDGQDGITPGGTTDSGFSATGSSATTSGSPSVTSGTFGATTGSGIGISNVSAGAVNSATSGSPTTGAEGSTTGGIMGTSGMVGTQGGMSGAVGMTGVGGASMTTSDGTTGDASAASTTGGVGGSSTVATTGSSTTGAGGMCQKGMTAGDEVAIIGDSFIAITQITSELESLASANGSLQPGESYVDNSVSGTRLGGGAIPGQYTQAQSQNPIRFVLMNGGGNDCLQANDPDSPVPAAEAMFEEMAQDGVEKVVYFFYPDPASGGFDSLQSCLDELRPKMKTLCDGLTSPECHWLDLRESWDGNEANYTSDGIHPNGEGSRVTAEVVWDAMVDNCVAQ